MRERFKNILAWSVIPQIILVKWLGSHPIWIEKVYSLGFYAAISRFLRRIYGWIPISLGDLAYIGLILIMAYLIWTKRNRFKKDTLKLIRDFISLFAVAYFSFNLLWGLNYYRIPLADTLELAPQFSEQQLLRLTEDLITQTNNLQVKIVGDSINPVIIPYSREEVFNRTKIAYTNLSLTRPQFEYRTPSLKPSLISLFLTYMGYSGYLNPFTNEAQVNYLIPTFRLPVVTAHEIAHQLGYSAENEANFIGYLTIYSDKDLYFKYSASAYALAYCLNEINRRDEKVYTKLMARINHGVLSNYQELKDFWETYKNPTEPVFKEIFSTFLKANNQRDGIASYSRVVALLISYHKDNPLMVKQGQNPSLP